MTANPKAADLPIPADPRAPGKPKSRRSLAGGSSLLALALSLPGVAPQALAANPPEEAEVGLKYLWYRDWQPGLDRIHVRSPSLFVETPFATDWSFDGSLVSDSVSGATPRWHTAKSSASYMHDHRRASDFSFTRYFRRATLSAGGEYSNEHDYDSRGANVNGTLSTEDNNTTFSGGLAANHDTINPVNHVVRDEHKNTQESLMGVTQVLSPNDIGQVNLTYSQGRGYFSDPYKLPDNRPRERNEIALLFSENHYFDWAQATSKLQYRFYHDTFGVRAHTVSLDWVQSLPQAWTAIPGIRYTSQSAARFYYDPIYDSYLGEPFPPGYGQPGGPTYYSADQRLSSFGAVTVSMKLIKAIDRFWTVDLKGEAYEQRASWRFMHQGSMGLEPFHAIFFEFGISRKF